MAMTTSNSTSVKPRGHCRCGNRCSEGEGMRQVLLAVTATIIHDRTANAIGLQVLLKFIRPRRQPAIGRQHTKTWQDTTILRPLTQVGLTPDPMSGKMIVE